MRRDIAGSAGSRSRPRRRPFRPQQKERSNASDQSESATLTMYVLVVIAQSCDMVACNRGSDRSIIPLIVVGGFTAVTHLPNLFAFSKL